MSMKLNFMFEKSLPILRVVWKGRKGVQIVVSGFKCLEFNAYNEYTKLAKWNEISEMIYL
jgi:hypothetical protein